MGRELKVFRAGLALLWAGVEASLAVPALGYSSGLDAFDGPLSTQRLAILSRIGAALSDPAEPAPELTA